MTIDHQKFMEELQNETVVFRKHLSAESDRGCALFATAYLDKALSNLLFRSVVYEPKKIDKELFDFNSPLGTFSSRIKMAYYLGIISKVTRRDLNLMRKIRNNFAHHPTLVSFNDENVANQCRELKFSFRKKDDDPRSHFLGAAFGILAQIHNATLFAVAPDQKPDDEPTDEEKAAHRKRLCIDD